MPDLSTPIYLKPAVMDYTRIGTAVGTTTISTESCYLDKLIITNRVASSVFIFYDSVGTSTNVIGTVTLGTNTADDPPTKELGFRTQNALTVAYTTANAGAIVAWGR